MTGNNSRRRLSKIIQLLKQTGEGARGVLKGGAYASRLKFRKQMVLSDRSGRILMRELEQEALRNDFLKARTRARGFEKFLKASPQLVSIVWTIETN